MQPPRAGSIWKNQVLLPFLRMIQASEDEQRVNPSLLSFLEQIVAPALGVEPTIEVVHGNKQQVS